MVEPHMQAQSGLNILINCMILTIILGLPITLIFIRDSTPKTGNRANMLSFELLGILFIIGMVLGKN
jgi:hypothetical protein